VALVSATSSGNVTWAGCATAGGPLSPCSRTASAPNARSTRQRRPACSTTVPGTNRCSTTCSSDGAAESGNAEMRTRHRILADSVHTVRQQR